MTPLAYGESHSQRHDARRHQGAAAVAEHRLGESDFTALARLLLDRQRNQGIQLYRPRLTAGGGFADRGQFVGR